jgi:serine/threonine-protein kinase
MGSVWRALHLALGAPVAVKLIDPSIAEDPEMLARFQREAVSAASLRSPHVVQIIDHGVDDLTKTPFIVMELMEGESLGERLERLRLLSPAEAVRILTQVARALTRAHGAGVVHRDLKPDNIFLVRNDDEDIAKVLDFGIAKVDSLSVGGTSTATGMVMGTAYYMSPEQIRGARSVDHHTDLWALGVIAHECLTGHRPFVSDTIGDLVLQICMEEIRPASSFGPVLPGFDDWFAKAVARDPADRFHSAREMVDALSSLIDGSEQSAVALGPGQQRRAPSGTLMVDTNPSAGRPRAVPLVPMAPDTASPVSHTGDPPVVPRRPLPVFALAVGLGLTGLIGAALFVMRSGEVEEPSADVAAAREAGGSELGTPPAAVQPDPSNAKALDVRPAAAPAPKPADAGERDGVGASTKTSFGVETPVASSPPPPSANQPVTRKAVARAPVSPKAAGDPTPPAPVPSPSPRPRRAAPVKKPPPSVSDILNSRK